MTTASARIPWRSPTVRVVLLSTLLAPLGVPLVSPALPAVRAAFALSDAQASLLVSSYFLTGIVLSPIIGLLVDRLGRRRVLLPSLIVFSLAGVVVTVGPSYPVVLALRVIQGTAAAGIFITTVTLVGDTVDGLARNAVLGVNAAVLSVGAAVYPLLGGYLATISWNAPFSVYAFGLPVAVVAARWLPEPAVQRRGHGGTYFGGVLSTLSLADKIVLYGTTLAVEVVLFGSVFTALPFLLDSRYGLSGVGIGLTITVASLASAGAAWGNSRLARSLSDSRVLGVGLAAAGVGLVGVGLAAQALWVGVAGAVVGAAWGVTVPSVDSALSRRVPGQFRAGALSLRNSTTFLGRAAGPFLFSRLAASYGYQRVLFAAGGLTVLAALSVLGLSRR